MMCQILFFLSVFHLNCRLALKLTVSSRAAGEGPGEAEQINAALMRFL